MPIYFKPIDPGKFRSEAFAQALKSGATPYAEGVARDYRKTWQTWSRKSRPTLKVDVKVNSNGGVAIEIDVEGQIYEWVHEGTRPHVIKPRRARRLAFQSGYKPKTQPGMIGSVSGGPFGPMVFRRVVRHPGFKGRNFSKPISQKWKPAFYRAMQRAIEKGADNSGHGM